VKVSLYRGGLMLHRSERLFVLVVVFVALAAGCSGTSADPSSVLTAPPAQRLQSSIDSNWSQYQGAHGLPGGGMCVYLETPTGNYFASAGMQAGIDGNTRFRIASNTKTFTSAAIMLLDQQGKLHIDDTIVSLIPGLGVPYAPNTAQYDIPYKTSITIRQLLSHTAGVYDVTNEEMSSVCPAPYAGQNYLLYVIATDPDHQFSPDELVGVNATCQASYFSPGNDYHYSNTGYSILATIIERVSGLSYDQFVIQNLITPNGLTSTSVPMLATDQAIPPPFSPGYVYDQGAFMDVTQDNMSMNIAEGNVISTPADLARWVRRLLKAQAGPNGASLSAMMTLTPQSHGSYGLGINYISGLGYGHTGAHPGYLSLMVYDPSADVTTVLYFNLWYKANMATDQAAMLLKAARDARTAVGY
jgi:D-alanyl-D-alanine carboxypeptidase